MMQLPHVLDDDRRALHVLSIMLALVGVNIVLRLKLRRRRGGPGSRDGCR